MSPTYPWAATIVKPQKREKKENATKLVRNKNENEKKNREREGEEGVLSSQCFRRRYRRASEKLDP